MIKKLEFKHIAPYLPYGLEVQYIGGEMGDAVNLQELCLKLGQRYKITGISMYRDTEAYWLEYGSAVFGRNSSCFKPAFIPLSAFKNSRYKAFDKIRADMIERTEILTLAKGTIDYSLLNVGTFETCLRNHIDVFNLIPAGLAVAKS